MNSHYFFIVAVIIGIFIISVVLYKFIKGAKDLHISITMALCLMAFLLISSPLWTNINVKSENIEIGLYRDLSSNQADVNIELIDNLISYIKDQKTIDRLENKKKEIESLKIKFETNINKEIVDTLATTTTEVVEISRPKPPKNLRIIQ